MFEKTKIPKCNKTFNELYELWQNAKKIIPPATAENFIAGLGKLRIAQLFHDLVAEMVMKYWKSEGFKFSDDGLYKVLDERKGSKVFNGFTKNASGRC